VGPVHRKLHFLGNFDQDLRVFLRAAGRFSGLILAACFSHLFITGLWTIAALCGMYRGKIEMAFTTNSLGQ